MWREIFAGGALWLSIYGTFVLNFCDFTRTSHEPQVHRQGQLLGHAGQHAASSVSSPSCSPARSSRSMARHRKPDRHRSDHPEHLPAGARRLALLVLTIAVNLMANFVAPIYALTNLFPKKPELPPRRADQRDHRPGDPALESVQQSAGDRVLPGRARRPARPVVRRDHGRLLADPQDQVNVPELYTEAPNGDLLLPRWRQPARHRGVHSRRPHRACSWRWCRCSQPCRPFSWFIGAGIAALALSIMADRQPHYDDVTGESIAVPSVH